MRYMKYQEFTETVKEHIQQELQKPVQLFPVLKNNGAIYDGLVILDPILNISPTIYLNPYYHRYLDGVSMEDIYEDILNTYHENLPDEDFDVSVFRDYDKAKERIVMKLVNAKKKAISYTCPVLNKLEFDGNDMSVSGTTTLVEDFKEYLTWKEFNALRDRADFQSLFKL